MKRCLAAHTERQAKERARPRVKQVHKKILRHEQFAHKIYMRHWLLLSLAPSQTNAWNLNFYMWPRISSHLFLIFVHCYCCSCCIVFAPSAGSRNEQELTNEETPKSVCKTALLWLVLLQWLIVFRAKRMSCRKSSSIEAHCAGVSTSGWATERERESGNPGTQWADNQVLLFAVSTSLWRFFICCQHRFRGIVHFSKCKTKLTTPVVEHASQNKFNSNYTRFKAK